jgi:AraC-like DNA-binding protein
VTRARTTTLATKANPYRLRRNAATECTVSSGYARGLLELAVSKGARREALLERAGIDPAVLDDQDNRVPLVRYATLMREAKAMSDDAALGLHYGEAVNIADISIVGLITRAGKTMSDVFDQLNRFVQLIVETENAPPGHRYILENGRKGVWVVDNRRNPNSFPELTESAFAQLVWGPRRFGAPPFVKAMTLTFPDPGYVDEYERVFDVRPEFGSNRNAFLVDRELADLHVAPQLPPYVFGVLNDRAEALLKELQGSHTVRSRVEAMLIPVLHKGEIGMEAMAAQLGVSRQTLFRKLKAEGVTFEKLLDSLRYRLALDYLSGRKVSVNETSYLVGFSDPAAFSRAFKRWTGSRPREARNALLRDAGKRE